MPSSGSRWAGSIGVTVSRRSPRGRADEVGDEVVGGVAEQLGGGAVLREPAAGREDRHPVAHPHRLVDVVGDHHDGLAQLALQPQELVLQPDAHDRVDGAERLVHQQHRRIGGQRPRHADALPLAAGELVRVAVARTSRGRGRPGRAARVARSRAMAFDSPYSSGTVITLVTIFWCGNSPTCWIT